MEFKEVMHARHSVRSFKAEKVPVEVLKDIVMGIALGYAAEDSINAFASTRLPLEDIFAIKQ